MKRIAASLLLLSQLAQADPLGRLFFTPAERAALEQTRVRPGAAGNIAAPGNASARQAAVSVVDQSFGSIERQDGGSTVWIDGVPRYLVQKGRVK